MLKLIMELEAMNARTKFGIALMVVTLFVFQPFSKCFGAPAARMAHDCCPAPSKAECTMASCVCKTTDATSAPIPVASESAPMVQLTVDAEELAVPIHRPMVSEGIYLPLNDRFVVLHQFLI